MKNKGIKLALLASCVVLLGGCDFKSKNEEIEALPIQEDIATNSEESELKEYQIRYAEGEFTVEDYKTLAQLYAEAGMRMQQRDILEECYRLYDDPESLDILQGIVVNIAEESESIQEEARRMLENIKTPEYLNEAAGMLISSDWSSLMMPVLKEGSRKYYLAGQDGQPELYIETGIDPAGMSYSAIWSLEDEGRVRCLMQSADTLQLLETGIAEGSYQGAFELWLCIAGNGDIYHESGTFEQGICVGDYFAQVKYGEEATDLFALWCSRENMEMTDYWGSFSETGATTLSLDGKEQKNIVNGGSGSENFIVYAASEDEKEYLFMNVPEGTLTDDFVFDHTILGIYTFPQFQPYEPSAMTEAAEAEKTISSLDVKVRVYDSQIQWFDGSSWHNVGSVEEYVKEDPFRVYQERPMATENEQLGGTWSDIYKNRGTVTVKEEPADNPPRKTDNKTGSKATAPPAAPPAAPAPAPTVQPAAPKATPQKQPVAPPADSGSHDSGSSGGSHDSGSSGGGSDSGSSGGGSHDSGSSGGGSHDSGSSGGGSDSGNSGGGSDSGSGGGGSDSGSSGGGDVDIEWTNDIL